MAAATAFSVTWDYRCPFARNAHEHVLAGLRGGAGWDVRFVPFSLGQVHVAEDETPLWERPGDDKSLIALQAGVWVRDHAPDRFGTVHTALFAARHDRGLDLRDPEVVAGVVADHGLDAKGCMAAIEGGELLATLRDEHEAAAHDHGVWGVPTFVLGDQAVFVRIMDRPGEDTGHARATVERVLDLMSGAPTLNEYKHTTIPR